MIEYTNWTAPITSQSEMLQKDGATSSPQQVTAITTHQTFQEKRKLKHSMTYGVTKLNV